MYVRVCVLRVRVRMCVCVCVCILGVLVYLLVGLSASVHFGLCDNILK